MKTKQYAYWCIENSESEDDGYWMMYDTLEDAVHEAGDGAEIYTLTAKYLGCFKRKAVIQRVKKSKKVSKAKKVKENELQS